MAEYQELYDAVASFVVGEKDKGEFATRPSYENDIVGTLYFDAVEEGLEGDVASYLSSSHVVDWQDWYWVLIDDAEQWDDVYDQQDHYDIYDSGSDDSNSYGDPIGGVFE